MHKENVAAKTLMACDEKVSGSTGQSSCHEKSRSKVPWYRNSFGDTVPLLEIPSEPLTLDPPIQIPPDLRPRGTKQRYLGTLQLLEDPQLEDHGVQELECTATTSNSLPSGTLSCHQSLTSSKQLLPSKHKCLKSVSQKNLVLDRLLLMKKRSNFNVEEKETSISEKEVEKDPPTLARNGEKVPITHDPATSITAMATGSRSSIRLNPIDTGRHNFDREGESATFRALGQRQFPREEIHRTSEYFGKSAKEKFYAQYKHLYSRPYLFIDSKAVNDEADVTPLSRGKLMSESSIVAAYPSTLDMLKVNEALPQSTAKLSVDLNDQSPLELPLRDKLSPRAHFLASCIAKSEVVAPFLIRNQTTKVFDFSFQSLGDASISAFAKCLEYDLPCVEEISVRDNRLSDEGLDELLRAVIKSSSTLHLRRLDISQNQIGLQSAQTLRSYLVSPACTVEMLQIDNADIDDYECAAFMTAFEKNQSVKRLWMSRNRIGKAENLNVVQPNFTTGGEAIASMLHVNTVLLYLDLSWNYLRLESSIALAKSICDNRTLVELRLAYNACADAGAMMFGEALRFNKTLEVLDLAYNSIGVKGAMVLANALRSNRTLRLLQLSGNIIGREGGQFLMTALSSNRAEVGCTIELHACNLKTNLIMPIDASIHTARPLVRSASADLRGSGTKSSGDSNAHNLPVFDAKSNQIFNPREPAGRYTLNLVEPYDKMIAMELVRLATSRKGCRFLRMEYKPLNSAKRRITLVNKENLIVENQKGAGGHRSAKSNEEENTLETRGLDALFTNIDRDNSGYIDQDELMTVLSQIGLCPDKESVSSLLEKFDYNRSGYVEEGEFSAFFFHAVFQIIDEDQSGKIDADEIEEAFKMLGIDNYDEQEIADAITTYDISNDGEMEEYEFIEFMKDRLLDRIKLKLLEDLEDGVTLVDASSHKPWKIPESGQLWIDFLYDREAFATNDEAFRQGKISQAGLELLIRNITDGATCKAEQDDLFHVAIYDSEIRLTAGQAYQVLETCQYLKPESKKIETIALFLPQMLTYKEAQILVSRTLTLMQRCRLKALMGSSYSVVLGNPTAHYSFDLANQKDRIALNKLAEVAQSEKSFSKYRSGRADTSQHGNWENFRNEELDGYPIVLTNTFFHTLPRSGRVCFDYVSTTRPKKGTIPMSDRRFDQLIDLLQMDVVLPDALGSLGPTRAQRLRRELQLKKADDKITMEDDENDKGVTGESRKNHVSSSSGTRASILRTGWGFVMEHASTFRLIGATKENVGLKMVQIESAICDRWLSCEQASKIISCMPMSFHARPETARILFSRLIAIQNFYGIFDAMSRPEQHVCARMLGWLNVMNPMEPDRFYALNLSIHDEREMTKVLVDLAIGEPGENWLNQSYTLVQGEPGIPGWKLPSRWEKEDKKGTGVNRAGFIELEYYSGQDQGCAPVFALRRALMKRVLCGTRLFCL